MRWLYSFHEMLVRLSLEKLIPLYFRQADGTVALGQSMSDSWSLTMHQHDDGQYYLTAVVREHGRGTTVRHYAYDPVTGKLRVAPLH